MFFHKLKRKFVGISGMHCDKCAERIKHSLEELSDVDHAKVDYKKAEAIIYYSDFIDDIKISSVIEELGYQVTGIKEIS